MPRQSTYDFIDDSELPDDVRDSVLDEIQGNDCGTIINPKYHPLFNQWLIDNGHEVKCYILWASW